MPEVLGGSRSGFSDRLVGSFLGHTRTPVPVGELWDAGVPDGHTPFAPPSDPRAPIMPLSRANASGYGTLLPSAPAMLATSSDTDVPDATVRTELALLSRYTLPIWATHILELSLSMVSVFSLGHLGTAELAAASLAGMSANVTGFSVLSGLICALDTLLPAAYTRQPQSMGLWTQRVGVIVGMTLPLIALLWLNAERGLLLLHQDPVIAHKAGQFLSVLVIGLPGHAVFELCRRFLQAQGLLHAPTVVLLIVSPLNAVVNYVLVWGPPSLRVGFLGAPLASALSMWLMAVLCVLQCMLVSNGTWGGWSRKAFDLEGLRVCFSLGIAGLLSLASEWWAWEIVGLVTAALGTTALASQSVLLITSSVTYQLPFGAAVAASVRVGNLLGAGRLGDAHVAAKAALVLSVGIGLFNSSLVSVFRNKWGYLFSSDPAVVQTVASVLPILALFQCADCMCGIAGGVLRGCGRQALSAVINLSAYYVVGIPMSLFLAFGPWQMGLSGLWWGLTVALIYGAAAALYSVYHTDWPSVLRRIHANMGLDEPGSV